ncbi:hypothetical protein Aasi_0913 [Candidatus Amoebophilus asiaticus 5a2]|uniref:Uncharacterized protein n=1 Tax=Amoebophilus asiaticus (strain 5a2) TaxID=452471 RepID=B3ESS7_AMOA5|nr:hypothetical protein [Candidatus Amoebophilus asiaticus]ACE06279.1 hypothetical protein Aasi_0913 [Candidatus Amoebophilus asiaticus 5a2]
MYTYFISTSKSIIIGILIVLFNTTSCDCSPNNPNKGDEHGLSGSLVIEVQDAYLIGDQKTIIAVVSLDDNTKPALLEGFILQVYYTSGTGEFEFTTYKNNVASAETSTSINEKLTSLVRFTELASNNSPTNITFSIVPNADVIQANIQVKLLDKLGALIKECPVTWEEDKLLVYGLNKFVGNNQSRFMLADTFAAIDPTKITLEIKSNNAATFRLVKVDGSKSSDHALLSELLSTEDEQNRVTDPMYLELDNANANGQQSAVITFSVKQGTTLLAKRSVVWEQNGISIDISSDQDILVDQDVLNLKFTNQDEVVDTEKIQVKLTNDMGVKFRLGATLSGEAISTNLQTIIDQPQLTVSEEVNVGLQQIDNPNEVYDASLILELLDEKGDIICKHKLHWINREKLNVDEVEQWLNKLDRSKIQFNQQKGSIENNLEAEEYNTSLSMLRSIIDIRKQVQEIKGKLQKKIEQGKLSKLFTNRAIVVVNQLIADIDAFVLESIKKYEKHIGKLAEEVQRILQRAKTVELEQSLHKNLSEIYEDIIDMESLSYYVLALAKAINIDMDKAIGKNVKDTLQKNVEKSIRGMVELGKYFKNEAVSRIEPNDAFNNGAERARHLADKLTSIAVDLQENSSYAYECVAQAYQYTAEAMLITAKKETHFNYILQDAEYARNAANNAADAAWHVSTSLKDNNTANQAVKAALQAAIKAWQLALMTELISENNIPSSINGESTSSILKELKDKLKHYQPNVFY